MKSENKKEPKVNDKKTDLILPFLLIITGYLYNVNYFIIVPGALILVVEAIKILKDVKLKKK